MNLKTESQEKTLAAPPANAPPALEVAGEKPAPPPPASFDAIDEDLESHSSMLEKVDTVTRAKIRRALVDRDPATYRGVYQKFKAVMNGVSFTAFYYYARRIRLAAAIAENARRALPANVALNELLPDMIARRLLEEIDNPGAAPRRIQRLVDAYSMVSRIHLARRRAEILLAPKIRENAEAEKKVNLTPDEQRAHLVRMIRHVYGLGPETPQRPPAAGPRPESREANVER